MVEKICSYIVNKMRKSMPEIDDERAEIIQYGMELIIGEIPKIILLFTVAFILRIGWLTIFAYLAILPYRTCSGGFHLKTHISCILSTSTFYYGVVLASKFITLQPIHKYILIGLVLVFGIIMITLYAPADTENLPILTKKERKTKKILSYIFLSINMVVALFIPNTIISNLIIIGTGLQTISITRIAYILTKNKYGYGMYLKEQNKVVI